MSVASAIATEDELILEYAKLDRLAAAIDDPNCPYRDLNALMRQMDKVTERIAVLRAARQADAEEAANADEGDDESFDPNDI